MKFVKKVPPTEARGRFLGSTRFLELPFNYDYNCLINAWEVGTISIDHSIILAITLNIALLLTISWLGIRFINNRLDSRLGSDKAAPQVSTLVRRTSCITPRIKISFRIRRMIKTASDNDETPFFAPQLT